MSRKGKTNGRGSNGARRRPKAPKTEASPEVEKFIAESGLTKTAFADICGVTRGALRYWKHVPAEYVLRLEKASGGKLSRHVMRPDIYPVERRRRAARA